MLGTDRDALLCDLAETYHIYGFGSVPVMTLSALCAGLPDDSRIKMKMLGLTRIAPTLLWVQLTDTLTTLAHALCAKEGSPMPTLFHDIMTGKQTEKEKPKGFDTFEAFEEARRRIIGHE